jgi:hypothetical protein
MGKMWAAVILNSFLFKSTLAVGKCSFYHHFFKKKKRKKKSQKTQRHSDVTERGDPGHNQKWVSSPLPPKNIPA